MRKLATGFLMFPVLAHAGAWYGEAGLGYLQNDGNAQSRSLNGKLVVNYQDECWKNVFAASAINSADAVANTAERYTVGDQLNHDFTENDYIFGALDWEKDLFGGIRERTSETAGYGRHLLRGPVHTLDTELGLGARQTEQQITGLKESDMIGRASARYLWNLTQTSSFGESAKVESGQSNTYLESITELKLAIVGNLFAALSYTVKNNSQVPAGTENTDTSTAINLTYNFGNKPE